MSPTPNQLAGYVFGATFIALGILGFTVSGEHDFAGQHGGQLLGVFEVNTLHNIIHLIAGSTLIAGAAAGATVSRKVNLTLGVIYLVVGVLGLFIGSTSLNLLALNGADNFVHLAESVTLIGLGLVGDRYHSKRMVTST
ncbi:DUF4383 domain-containing protein [Lentzea tibetensis]|uniref:DUF4383 domain-containing protein n=1 Tax=Lentzea tibetensis TaxID=2591470 RepID=A0A563F2T6_9PSEU|nr:DUF4383 domain-containing protein [Lentzea tibetensis]TWP54270.1 DUF4383 domain-containing protein [Lentzea tibetensis]